MPTSDESAGLLCADLKRRLKTPIKSVTFYLHLFGAIIICGGAGIWYTWYQDGFVVQKLSGALLTYFPALVAAAVIDFTHEDQPYLRSFGVLSGILFITLFLITVSRDSNSYCQFGLALVGTVLSILFWWFANGEKRCFKDVVPINAAGGQSAGRMLPGTTKGWDTSNEN